MGMDRDVGLYGTCAGCDATCVQVYLVNRGDEEGICASCVADEQIEVRIRHLLRLIGPAS